MASSSSCHHNEGDTQRTSSPSRPACHHWHCSATEGYDGEPMLPTLTIPSIEWEQWPTPGEEEALGGVAGSSMRTTTPNAAVESSADSLTLIPSYCDRPQLQVEAAQHQFQLLPELPVSGPLAATSDHGDGEPGCELDVLFAVDSDVDQFLEAIMAEEPERKDGISAAVLISDNADAGLPTSPELHSAVPQTPPQPLALQPLTTQPITTQPLTPLPLTPQPITPQPFTPQPIAPESLTPLSLVPAVHAPHMHRQSRHETANRWHCDSVGAQLAPPIGSDGAPAATLPSATPPHVPSPSSASPHTDFQRTPFAAATPRHDAGAGTVTASQAGGEAAESGGDVPPTCTRYKLTRNRNYSEPGRYRGVRKRGEARFSAQLKVGSFRRWLGTYKTAEEAARAFDKAALELSGCEAKLNFPPPEMEEMRGRRRKRTRAKRGTGRQAAGGEPKVQAATQEVVTQPNAEFASRMTSAAAIGPPSISPARHRDPVAVYGEAFPAEEAATPSSTGSDYGDAGPGTPRKSPVLGPKGGAPALMRMPLGPRSLEFHPPPTLRLPSSNTLPARSVRSTPVPLHSPQLHQRGPLHASMTVEPERKNGVSAAEVMSENAEAGLSRSPESRPLIPQTPPQPITPQPLMRQSLINAVFAPHEVSQSGHQTASSVGAQQVPPILSKATLLLLATSSTQASATSLHVPSPSSPSPHSGVHTTPLAAAMPRHDAGAATITASQAAGEAAESGGDMPPTYKKYKLTRDRNYSEPERYRGVRK